MDQNIKNKIEERFSSLPKGLQDAITSSNLRPTLQEIVKEKKLHIDQGALLEDETLLVMLGLESSDNFSRNLQDNLKINPIQANEITEEINLKIFVPIRQYLEDVYKEDGENVVPLMPTSTIVAEDKPPEVNQTPEQIINEIENPVETVHPITQAIQPTTSSGNVLKSQPDSKPKIEALPQDVINEITAPVKLPEIAPTRVITGAEPTVIPTPQSLPLQPTTPTNIVQNKLNSIVSSAKEDIIVKPNAEPVPKTYTVDPYREATN